jgi:putative membrane protein
MHDHGSGPSIAGPLLVVAIAALTYLLLALRLHSRSRGWSVGRTAMFMSGCAVLAIAILPQYLPFAEGDFRKHMLQHLLMGMLAPLGLVMSAPITLVLRTAPARWGRVISSILRSRPLQLVANPVTALFLNMGGMAALYFTPLYTAMMIYPRVHYFVHFHFVAVGCLFTWVIAGPDPAPRRPSVPARLVVLGIAVIMHSVLAQLLYSGAFVAVAAPVAQLQHGAELMYYGGDITEMLLAVALVTTWRPVRKPVASTGHESRFKRNLNHVAK